jgi:DNA modification methylase
MRASPSLAIEYLPLGALTRYERNARTHSAAQVSQIVASIKQFGWTNPLLIDEGGLVIAGHGRLSAARELGMAEVPVIRLAGLTEEQKRALTLADNKLALNAGWDELLLKAELQSLGDLQGVVGFSNAELMRLFKGHAGLTDPDSVLELPATAVTQPRDVWVLGPHRLVCGDATLGSDVAAALAGMKAPYLMVTDPPYGVDYDPTWRAHASGPDGRRLSKGRVSMGAVLNDDRSDWRQAWKLFPGSVAYVWHGGLTASAFAESLQACDFELRSQIIWAKQQIVIGRGDYHWMHEPCWYAVRKGSPGKFVGDRKQRTVWEVNNHSGLNDKDDGQTAHGTQKPVELMRLAIQNSSSEGDTVYDPFVGSGTTIIACEMMQRACVALDIDGRYCDVAVKRWEAFTGRKAERQPAAAPVAA